MAPHDARQALTVDPVLAYTRTFGGSGRDTATLIATDAQGNIYVGGTSNSVDFPTSNGAQTSVTPPLLALSGPNSTMPLPVGVENTIPAVGGTPDGSVLYAAAPGAFYVSGDGGASWQQGAALPVFSQIPISNNNTPTGIIGVIGPAAIINNIAVDPVDPSRVFVATTRGLYFSSQGGQSWFLHEYGLASSFDGSVNVSWVGVSSTDRNLMYATTGNPNGLFKSTDAGNTWYPVSLAYPGKPPDPPTPYSPVIAAIGLNGSDLYVVDTSTNLLKSTDGGTTWQLLGQGLYGTRAIYFDPSNSSNIYVLDSQGVHKSVDGGRTFAVVVPSLPGVSRVPVERLAVDSSGIVYVGSTSTLYTSTDGGYTLNAQAATQNLHTLVAVGNHVYAGFETPSIPFVVKWDPTGSRILYSTFVGIGNANVTSLKVDAQGNCVLGGTTFSVTFLPPSNSATPRRHSCPPPSSPSSTRTARSSYTPPPSEDRRAFN